MAAVGALGVWCVVVAFIARACVPRSLDLRVYRDAARLAVHGGAVYTATFTPQHFPFTYPPFALIVFAPLVLLAEHPAIWAFDAIGAVALVVALTVTARHVLHWPRTKSLVLAALLAGLACLALEPLRSTLLDGQVNPVLVAAVVVDLLVVPPSRRGILVGLAAAVKLTPLVFVGYLVLAGERRAAARAAATFAGATLVAWLVAPADSRTFWLHQAFSPGRRGASRTAFNQSWWGLVGRLPPADGWVRTAVWLALCAATVAVAAVVTRRCLLDRHHLDAIIAVAVAGLLVSPISWTHHWCWLALAPIALVAPRPRPGPTVAATALALVVAVAAPYGWHLTGPGSVVAGFSLTLAGALMLAVMALDGWRLDRRVAALEPLEEATATGARVPAR